MLILLTSLGGEILFFTKEWQREKGKEKQKKKPKHQALAYYAKLWFLLSINKQLLLFLRKYLKIIFISIQLIQQALKRKQYLK